ncbi:hypothetical protein C0993_011664 [Termitomyces sp. T159_Od127]|nr:hypothetical protein C0993_011664 [Termitomyces sp. T159_Od127]
MAANAYKFCPVLLWFFSWAGTGSDPNAPKPLLAGMARIYRGLGVSAVRSITTHGLLWTLFDMVGSYIDRLPYAHDSDSEY